MVFIKFFSLYFFFSSSLIWNSLFYNWWFLSWFVFVSLVLLRIKTDATHFATIYCANDTDDPFYWELWTVFIPDYAVTVEDTLAWTAEELGGLTPTDFYRPWTQHLLV